MMMEYFHSEVIRAVATAHGLSSDRVKKILYFLDILLTMVLALPFKLA